jgi:amidase
MKIKVQRGDSVPDSPLYAMRAVSASLSRIAACDGQLKAFLTVSADTATCEAKRLDAMPAPVGPLHGLPVAIKDLTDTAGLRTTYGSRLFADNIPLRDDCVVARLKTAGAIIIGKTMTPEFGFGAICTNPLGGPTANPWDMDLTSGGSSGGAAVAVATGMVPLAHGTDFGGSVRTPASFCGVLSIRPTPGLLPNPTRALGYDMLSTAGYLARNVAMLRRALKATAGPDAGDPLSLNLPKRRRAIGASPLRIAATLDFGVAPIANAVRGRFWDAINLIPASLGGVTQTHPDCSDAFSIFHILRPALIRHSFNALHAKQGDALTQTVRWWIERGAGITAGAYLEAETRRTAMVRRFLALFANHDVLVAPAASVMPWPNAVPDVLEIDGIPMETIADYLAITFIVSLTGCPVVTLPVPMGSNALPFGVQLIGPPGSDLDLLAVAARFEGEPGFRFRAPPGFR